MTAGRRDHAGLARSSLRHQGLSRRTTALSLVLLVAVGFVALVAPLVTQRWFGGDLLYHSGLTSAILRGEFLPGGPYEGLPAYYPPGFHVMVAGVMQALGTSFDWAVRILTILWLPVLPIGTYILARHLTGRHAVAILAAVLTMFGGGLDFSADRTWVNSLFISGQAAAPVYPRDIVFALLPWAAFTGIRALESAEARGAGYLAWASVAGLLLGIAALIQVQLLLPIPFAFAAVAAARARRRRAGRLRLVAVLAVSGGVAVLPVLPWIVTITGEIVRNGGLSLESSESLVPIRLGFWDIPRQFGLILPAALIGTGVALLFGRGSPGPRPEGETATRWHPSSREAPILLVAWAGLPFLLAFAYSPTWPFEDALRPQRLFLLAGQPMAILAAVGFVTAMEDLRAKWRWPRAVEVAMAVAIVGSTFPMTAITTYRAATAFATPMYAHLDLADDRVPDFRTIAPPGPGRFGLLTYEDWSAIAWYETASWIVAMNPPGYSKLAFDPVVFTGTSQTERRVATLKAFDGDTASLAEAADRFGMDLIVLAKRGALWGAIDQTAAILPAVDPRAVRGPWEIYEGNGWDALRLEGESSVTFQAVRGGFVHLAVRVQSARVRGRSAMRLVAVGEDGGRRTLIEGPVNRAGRLEDWQVVEWYGYLGADERLRIEAQAALFVQSLRGYVEVPSIPDGWTVRTDAPDFVVLARVGP